MNKQLKVFFSFCVFSLNAQIIYAWSNPVENPEMIPFMFIMVGGGLIICMISKVVSKMNKNKPFPVAFFYTVLGLFLIILVLFICIKLLIGVANKFEM